MAATTTKPSRHTAKRFGFVALKDQRLDRKLALAFGFMSFIPILLVVWAMVAEVPLDIAIYPIVASAMIGYFCVARRMVHSVITITEKARAISSGRETGIIEVGEDNEIGELARAFNRITQDLDGKIEELESSRELVKKLLSRIGTALVSYEGIDNILNLIVENTVCALEADMGSLLLVDGEKSELHVKTTWAKNGHVANQELRLKIGDGVAGWVVKEGRPLRSTADPATLGFVHDAAHPQAMVLCVPLRLREKPIGTVSVLRSEIGRSFTDDDEVLLESIGSQMAVAIENYRLNLDVERTYIETIMALAMAVEAKDPYSAGHSKRVGFYARQIGEVLGLGADELELLNAGGVLHDIGKIGIKDEILLKTTHLNSDEEKIMQQHPIIGEAIVKPVRSLQKTAELIRHHHESYDGTGYPSGLKGEEIPLGARILVVADTFDAMVTDRPYRKRLSVEIARAELNKLSGIQFDPKAVDAFMTVLDRKDARLLAQGQRSASLAQDPLTA